MGVPELCLMLSMWLGLMPEPEVQVDKDLREMLVQPNAPKPKLIGLRIWPKAIPQFNVGHQETIQVCLSSCHFVACQRRKSVCCSLLLVDIFLL